jgi:hypothetical protein
MTVHQELRGMGFHGRAAAHKPNTSPMYSKRHLKWRKERRHWTVDNWKHVIWSDESRYTTWQTDRRVWLQWMPGEPYLPECVVPTVKFGRGGIRVWGCFLWNGTGLLVILHGNVNMEKYEDILTCWILTTVEDQLGDDSCLYQHGNAPCHWRNCLWTMTFQKWNDQPRVLTLIP